MECKKARNRSVQQKVDIYQRKFSGEMLELELVSMRVIGIFIMA